MKNNKGFSLVELIVVIAIMAILATVAVIGVSVYIPKAQEANDNELLNVMTDALTAACLSEGIDQREVVASVTVNADGTLARGNDGKITLTFSGNNLTNDQKTKITETFNSVLSDDNAKFNLITSKTLTYRNGAFGVSVVLGVQNGDKVYYYEADAEKADALTNSVFIKNMGIDTTLSIMDKVAQFATGIGTANSTALNQVQSSPDFMKALVRYLGIDYEVTDATDPGEFYGTLVDDYGVTEDMVSNALILYSTEKASDMSTDSVKDLLGSDGAKDKILVSLNNDTATAMTQTAAAYALYIGYLHTLDNTQENQDRIKDATDNPLSVLEGLDDPNFQAYINDSDNEDIEGYLAAMGMLNEASGTSNGQGGTAAGDILNEGFNTSWMEDLLNQATNN